MYKIQSNQSGTRSIDISEKHLETIEKHQLFRDLIDSNGFVDEQVRFEEVCRIAKVSDSGMTLAVVSI